MPPDREFFFYCSNEPLQEQKISDVSFCNNDIADLPVEQRYLVHCMKKGWRPCVAGLIGFIRLSQLGYYKTL